MTLTLPRAPRRATAALAALALLPLAGCGGDDATPAASGDGLAKFAPKDVPFYVEAAVRPEGDLAKNLDAAIAKFAPGQSAEKLLSQAFKGKGDVSYEADIKPWLGERAGLAVTTLPTGGGDPDVAAFVQTKDDGKAALALLRKEADGPVKDEEYNGVKYILDSGGSSPTAAAVMDGTLVIGSDKGFKAAVDASKGDGLDTNADYKNVVSKVEENAVATIYADVAKAFELAQASARASGQGAQLEGVRELLNRQDLKTVGAGIAVTEASVKLKAAAAQKDSGDPEKVAETVANLPAGSWAAFGLGDVGKSISEALDGLKTAKAPGLDVEAGLKQLEQQAGIDVQKDLLDWMGQTGLFLRGTSITDIGGALVVQSKDPAATKAALSKARTLVAGGGLSPQALSGAGIDDGFSAALPGSTPVEVFAALAGDRFILAVTKSALDEAVKPSAKLGDDDAFKSAAGELGDGLEPTFLLDFPKVAGLVGLAAGSQPGFEKIRGYLDRIGVIVAGGKRDGDLNLRTLSVGLK